MSAYDRKVVGVTIAGTRQAANDAINARFGANSIAFATPVGPIGQDAVTHWGVASATRSNVLGVFASETNQLHGGPGTSTDAQAGQHQTITRDSDGAILGAWSTYTGGYAGWTGWLASQGLEVKEPSIDGDQPIDTIIAAANAAEESP